MKKLFKQFRKSQRGITLVALVITIIILLILAGVAIGTLRDNGLFEKANIAKQKQTEAEVKEKINLIVTEYIIEREQGKSLSQFLTEKKDNGEIDNFVDNNNGTFDIIINGYTTTINENDLSTTEPQILSDIMVTCLAKEFINNKIQALITVKSQSGEIKEIRLINNVTVQGNNKTTIAFDHIIEANKEYQIEVELTNGTSSTKTIKYEDTEAPKATIEITKKIIFNKGKIQANINVEDNRSGVNIAACKWVAVTESTNIGTDESLYTGGTLDSTTQTIETDTITEPEEYYIHLLLKDNVGNITEVISEKVEIKDGYEISKPEELQAMETNLTGHYYVTKDIDMTGFDFHTVGGPNDNNFFSGTLDGQGHTISNLTMTGSGSRVIAGINSATIKNILFKELNLNSTNYNKIGLVGETYGTNYFEKVGVTGTMTGYAYVAGLVALPEKGTNLFTNCYARVNIKAVNSGCGGGITGYYGAGLSFTNCYASTEYIGMTPCYSTNSVPTIDCFYNADLYRGDLDNYHAYRNRFNYRTICR